MRRLTGRQRLAAIVLAVVALGLLTLDLAGSGLRSSHDGVRGTLGALYRGTDSVLGPVRHFAEGLPSAGSDRGRIAALEHDNAQLRGRLAAAEARTAEQPQLAALAAAAARTGYRTLPARVTAIGSAAGFDWTATLDVGRADGVRVGQTVTDGYGLVGRVLHADDSSSLVLLAADPGSGVGARDLRTKQVGLATGAGRTGLTFAPLDPDVAVRVGDRLVTGPGGSSTFVAGLSLGVVSAVRPGAEGVATITVRPTTAPGSLDLVGVLLPSDSGSTSGGGGASAAKRDVAEPK